MRGQRLGGTDDNMAAAVCAELPPEAGKRRQCAGALPAGGSHRLRPFTREAARGGGGGVETGMAEAGVDPHRLRPRPPGRSGARRDLPGAHIESFNYAVSEGVYRAVQVWGVNVGGWGVRGRALPVGSRRPSSGTVAGFVPAGVRAEGQPSVAGGGGGVHLSPRRAGRDGLSGEESVPRRVPRPPQHLPRQDHRKWPVADEGGTGDRPSPPATRVLPAPPLPWGAKAALSASRVSACFSSRPLPNFTCLGVGGVISRSSVPRGVSGVGEVGARCASSLQT